MEKDVWHYITTHGLLRERQTVGAAVSGGADSMALLICLCKLSREHGFAVKALHFDHGTRGGASAEDAQFVREYCEQNGIPFILGHADVPQTARERKIGLELAGREARDAFFSQVAGSGEVDVVATAHHMDDNAESVLMHIVRGCGIDGLVGIHPERGILIRPMLGVTRRQIERYLEDEGVQWVTDESNENTTFDRNYIRHVVLPSIRERLNPSAAAAVRRLSESAAEDAQCLDEMARAAFDDCCTHCDGTSCRLDIRRLLTNHPAIAGRIIRMALAHTGRSRDVERAHVTRILTAAQQARTGSVTEAGGGIQARIEYGTLVIEKQSHTTGGFETPLQLPGVTLLPDGAAVTAAPVLRRGSDTAGSLCEYADADRIPAGAVIRTRRPGDVLRPLAGPGRRKLKEFFIDRKVPRQERDAVPLLASGSEVLWVIGGVLSEDIAVREGTSRICRLSYEKTGST